MPSITHYSDHSRQWNWVTASDQSSNSVAQLTTLNLAPPMRSAWSMIPPNTPCLRLNLLIQPGVGTQDRRFLSVLLPTVPNCGRNTRSSSALVSNHCNLRLPLPLLMLLANSILPNTSYLHPERFSLTRVGKRDLRQSRRFVRLLVSTLLCIDRSRRSNLALVSNLCRTTVCAGKSVSWYFR